MFSKKLLAFDQFETFSRKSLCQEGPTVTKESVFGQI